MYRIEDPEELSPEERLEEMAKLLAAGYLRMRNQTPGLDDQAKSTDATVENDEAISPTETEVESSLPSRRTLMVR